MFEGFQSGYHPSYKTIIRKKRNPAVHDYQNFIDINLEELYFQFTLGFPRGTSSTSIKIYSYQLPIFVSWQVNYLIKKK